MQDYNKLDVYKRAIEYSVNIYKFSTELPENEKYGLISQMRRAVSSIALNISEGAGCNSNKEFSIFINYAYRSCNEVLTCLELISKLGLSKSQKINELQTEGIEISRMIYSFLKRLKVNLQPIT